MRGGVAAKAERLRVMLALGPEDMPLSAIVDAAVEKLGLVKELEALALIPKIDACLERIAHAAGPAAQAAAACGNSTLASAFCTNCGTKHEPTDKFCKQCGTACVQAAPQPAFCTNCGKKHAPNDRFCML